MQISGKGHDPTRPPHPSHPPRPSRFPSSHPPRARVIARYIAFRTNRYPVRTLYASPPAPSHIDKSAAEQISNLLLDRLLSSPLPSLEKTRKLKEKASSACPTDLPPLYRPPLTALPKPCSLRSSSPSPRDSTSPFLPRHSFTPARYTYNEEVHRDAGSNTRRCDRGVFPLFSSPFENLFSVNYGFPEEKEEGKEEELVTLSI